MSDVDFDVIKWKLSIFTPENAPSIIYQDLFWLIDNTQNNQNVKNSNDIEGRTNWFWIDGRLCTSPDWYDEWIRFVRCFYSPTNILVIVIWESVSACAGFKILFETLNVFKSMSTSRFVSNGIDSLKMRLNNAQCVHNTIVRWLLKKNSNPNQFENCTMSLCAHRTLTEKITNIVNKWPSIELKQIYLSIEMVPKY